MSDRLLGTTVVVFDGVEITVNDLVKKYSAYSNTWVRSALKEGCRSHEEFTRRWQTNTARAQRLGGAGGKAAIMKHKQGLFK